MEDKGLISCHFSDWIIPSFIFFIFTDSYEIVFPQIIERKELLLLMTFRIKYDTEKGHQCMKQTHG